MIKENLLKYLSNEGIPVRQLCIGLGKSEGWFSNTNDKSIIKLLPEIKKLFPSLNTEILSEEITSEDKLSIEYVENDPNVVAFLNKVGKDISAWSFTEYIEGLNVFCKANGIDLYDKIVPLMEAEYIKNKGYRFLTIDPEIRASVAGLCQNPLKGNMDLGIDFFSYGRIFTTYLETFNNAVRLTEDTYRNATNDEKKLCDAIGAVYEAGEVGDSLFRLYSNSFIYKNPKAAASRWLTMWHPNTFLCVNKSNEKKLREYLQFEKRLEWSDYPDIIRRIHNMKWYKEAQYYVPMTKTEELCKNYCVALFDCLVYRKINDQN